jgi:hypothetical protein
MAAQLQPEFLAGWIRAELEAAGDLPLFDSLVARAEADGLDRDEAELDVCGQLAERRGLLDALERAAGDLWLAEVREALFGEERLERSGPSCIAWLHAAPGAIDRLALLSRALTAEPGKSVAELRIHGGSPGCSVR